MCKGRIVADQLFISLILRLGNRFGFTHDWNNSGEYFNVSGIPAVLPDPLSNIIDITLYHLLGRIHRKDRFCMFGRKFPPPVRLACLIQHRSSLWGWFADMRSGHLEIMTFMVNSVDFFRIRIHAALYIPDYSIILPAIFP